MTGVGWLTASADDVPAGDGWLGPRERRVLEGLGSAKRRADWRLGRWVAKLALGGDVEILAAGDGAPEAWRGEERLPTSVSLSHRGGRALVAVGAAGVVVGCDLERLAERPRRPPADTLTWTAREAAAKLRREGIGLEARDMVSVADGGVALDGAWRPLTVTTPGRAPAGGWWRAEPGWVMSVVSDPPAREPPLPPEAPVGDPGDQV